MSMVCPTYASEIAPKEIRGRITGLFQVVVVVGVAFSYWISELGGSGSYVEHFLTLTDYGVSFMAPSRGSIQWRIPIGFQLVPVGIMLLLLPILKESPRWLAIKHKDARALANLAWIRKLPADHPAVQFEYAEIVASIREAEQATAGASIRDCFVKGNRIRFVIAFVIFTLQQWSGQNRSVPARARECESS